MEKRFILAFTLSLLVLMLWSAYVSKGRRLETNGPTIKDETTLPVLSERPSSLAVNEQPAASLPTFKHSQDSLELAFIEPLAAIQSITFKAYQDYKFSLGSGFEMSNLVSNFINASISPAGALFTYKDHNKEIKKEFIFSKSSNELWLKINVQSEVSKPINVQFAIILGRLDISHKNINARYQNTTIATQDKVQHFNLQKNVQSANIKFLSFNDRYFSAIIEPAASNYSGYIKRINSSEAEIGIITPEVTLLPGQTSEHKFHIYLGPQDLKLINRINPAWAAIINYGTFDFISQILLQLLDFLHNLLRNWGLAIILLSLLVYLALYPLTLKQMRSMKEMQVLQPHIEELRKSYKDNPQRLNKEILELYRQHKVNPFGGCLPLLLQMPIFFALYQALSRSVVLKGAKFLWIKDLSEPDRLFTLPTTLPILGNELNILPIIMAIGMFFQQKMSTVNAASTTAEQQKLMLIIMPAMFGIIFYHMPSGLVLYWFVNSALMLFYQLKISRLK